MSKTGRALLTAAELPRLGSFAEQFVELELDQRWRDEVEALRRQRHGFWRTRAQRLARLYLSDFDANALTGMYRMQLLPEHAWRELLGSRARGRLLDVGAGSGDITEVLGACFDQVETTEVSRGMARRLRRRGWVCHQVDVTVDEVPSAPFDAVALLNVLDRCREPRRLLGRVVDLLTPGGTLIVALALPYQPFYFDGPLTPDPLERLSCGAASPASGPSTNWEDAARRLIERDLMPLGLTLVRFARVPYLSAGDSQSELYELDDVVAVLSKR